MEWREKLTPEQFAIMRKGGTEQAFTGTYWDHHKDGTYTCAACGATLFRSDNKFDSGSGWPSFDRAAEEGAVTLHDDTTLGMKRTEARCAACGSHLGHLFNDGPSDTTGDRFCVNSASLAFTETASPPSETTEKGSS